MIKGIVAIDSKRGMANDDGIPWDIPEDKKYYVDKLESGGLVLMGYGTYREIDKPYGLHDNYVATRKHDNLRDGFIQIADVRKFLQDINKDLWNIGGPGLLDETLDLLDELYITQVEGDFNCTKFLPEYTDQFTLASESNIKHVNGINYSFQVWQKND